MAEPRPHRAPEDPPKAGGAPTSTKGAAAYLKAHKGVALAGAAGVVVVVALVAKSKAGSSTTSTTPATTATATYPGAEQGQGGGPWGGGGQLSDLSAELAQLNTELAGLQPTTAPSTSSPTPPAPSGTPSPPPPAPVAPAPAPGSLKPTSIAVGPIKAQPIQAALAATPAGVSAGANPSGQGVNYGGGAATAAPTPHYTNQTSTSITELLENPTTNSASALVTSPIKASQVTTTGKGTASTVTAEDLTAAQQEALGAAGYRGGAIG